MRENITSSPLSPCCCSMCKSLASLDKHISHPQKGRKLRLGLGCLGSVPCSVQAQAGLPAPRGQLSRSTHIGLTCLICSPASEPVRVSALGLAKHKANSWCRLTHLRHPLKKRPNECKPVGDRMFAIPQHLEVSINVCYVLTHLHRLLLQRWFMQTRLKVSLAFPWLGKKLQSR